MKAKPTRAEEIRSFLLKNIPLHPRDIVSVAENHFKVTRTTVHRHLNTLIKEDKIFKSGTTNKTTYSLLTSLDKEISFPRSSNLSESDVWEKHFGSLEKTLSKNVYDICFYGFTEIFNNAIDHSQSKTILVKSSLEKNQISLAVYDDGIGIFKKIKDAKGLKDEREAVLQLSKGKLTTDPANHSGQGIFFTSRAFDSFRILSNGLCYMRDNREDDWFLESRNEKDKISTLVEMKISLQSNQTMREVFEKYEDPETLAFDKTHILVNLSKSNEDRFVSRSQAKRILENLDKFNHIVLDFRGIKIVGQAFVDEVFRVFQNQHPEIKIQSINENEDVKFMIDRGLATAAK